MCMKKIRTAVISIIVAASFFSCAYAEEAGLQYDDKEIFKQGYFELSTAGASPKLASYSANLSSSSTQCINSKSPSGKQGFQIRLETANLKTVRNPDRIFGLMHIPFLGAYINSQPVDIGLFIAVSTDSRVGLTPESAYVPVYLARRVRLTQGVHIGSPNRLLYLTDEYKDTQVQVQLRLVDFDSSDIDEQFAILNKLMEYGQGLIASGSDPAISALGALGSLIVKQNGKNDLLADFDFSLIPCAHIGAVPQPAFAEGYLVMIRDGFVKDTPLNLDWNAFKYDPISKYLGVRMWRCITNDGKESLQLKDYQRECVGYQEGDVKYLSGREDFTTRYDKRTYIVLSITKGK